MRRTLSVLATAVLSVAVSSYGATTAPVPTLTITRHPERRTPPPDPKAMEAASRKVNESLTGFRRIANQIRIEFEASTEYSTARMAMIDARTKLELTRQRTLVELRAGPDYLRQMVKVEKLEAQLRAVRREQDLREVSKLATVLMNERSLLTQMESNRLNDPAIVELRQQAIEAANLVASLQENLAQDLRKHPDWQAAQAAYLDAVRRRARVR